MKKLTELAKEADSNLLAAAAAGLFEGELNELIAKHTSVLNESNEDLLDGFKLKVYNILIDKANRIIL